MYLIDGSSTVKIKQTIVAIIYHVPMRLWRATLNLFSA
jgi:hypothetical protein